MKPFAVALVVLASGCASIPPVPPPTAECHDASFSYSVRKSSACMGTRGGVAQWLAEVPP
jgi:hypothetical protein